MGFHRTDVFVNACLSPAMSWPLTNKTPADGTYTHKSIRTHVFVRNTNHYEVASHKDKVRVSIFSALEASGDVCVCVCACMYACVERETIHISMYLFITIHPGVCCPAFLINKYQ